MGYHRYVCFFLRWLYNIHYSRYDINLFCENMMKFNTKFDLAYNILCNTYFIKKLV